MHTSGPAITVAPEQGLADQWKKCAPSELISSMVGEYEDLLISGRGVRPCELYAARCKRDWEFQKSPKGNGL